MTPRRSARWFAFAFALTLIGYPVAGLAAVFAGLPSWATSYPFRFAVVAVSVWLLIFAARFWRRARLPPVLVLFWVLYIGRLLVDTVNGPPGAPEALLIFVLTTLIPVVALARLAPFWDDTLVARAVFIVGTLVCIGGVLIGTGLITTDRQADNTTRLFLDTVNPITFGHTAASTLLAGGSLLYRGHARASWPLVLAGAAVALGCLALTGSRGPVLALAICALMVAVVQRRFGLLMVIVAVGAALVTSGSAEVVTRFQELETFDLDASALERLVVQANAIEIFLANPLLGGAFAEFDLNTYPHNLFIETAMALGVVGLVLICTLVLVTFSQVFSRLRQKEVLLPLLFVQYFIGFQFSSALWGASAFWACMALVLCRRRSRAAPAVTPSVIALPPASASPS